MLRSHLLRLTPTGRGSVRRVGANGLGLFSLDLALVDNLGIEAIRTFLQHTGLVIIENNRRVRASEFVVIDQTGERLCDEVSLREMAKEAHGHHPFILSTHFKRKQYISDGRLIKEHWRFPISDWGLHQVMVFNLKGLKCLVSDQRTDLYPGFNEGVAALRQEISTPGIYLGLSDRRGMLTALTDALFVGGKDLTFRTFAERSKVLGAVAALEGIPTPERDDEARKDFVAIDPQVPYWKESGVTIVSGMTTPKVVLNMPGVPAVYDDDGNLTALKRGWRGASSVVHFAEVLVQKAKPTAVQEVLHKTRFNPLSHAKYANQYDFFRRRLKDGETTERARKEINNRVFAGGA